MKKLVYNVYKIRNLKEFNTLSKKYPKDTVLQDWKKHKRPLFLYRSEYPAFVGIGEKDTVWSQKWWDGWGKEQWRFVYSFKDYSESCK